MTLEMHENSRENTGRLWHTGDVKSPTRFELSQGGWVAGDRCVHLGSAPLRE